MNRRVTVLLAAALMAGCNTSGRGAATTTTTASAPTTTSVTPSPSSTAAAASTAAALPDTSGDDLARVVAALDDLLGRAYTQPDLAFLDNIYLPDVPARRDVEAQLRYLIDNGLHYDDAGSQIRDITIVDRSVQGLAVIDATTSHGPQVIKDAAGKVVKTGIGWTPRRERYGLQLGPDGRWRIRDNNILGPA